MLARVLNADERTRLADEDAGDIGFALLWSAKEAAYKAAKKVQATLVFAPGRWQLECADLVMADGIKRGSVIITDHPPIIVSWRHNAHWLHCIAVHGPQTERIDSAVMALCSEESSSGTEWVRRGVYRWDA